MKVDRLIGILTLLLQREKITAPELAQRFEVSRRTINRDIETLCQAGIALITTQGQGGGIALAAEYKLNHTLLTPPELAAIAAGLKGLSHQRGLRQRFGINSHCLLLLLKRQITLSSSIYPPIIKTPCPQKSS